MWVLQSINDPGVRYCLLPGEEYTVGRHARCDVVIPPGDTSVSRRHASLCVEKDPFAPDDAAVRVSDASSSFGTYVGEKAIASSGNNSQADRIPLGSQSGVMMKRGDRVRFGLLSSLFSLDRVDLVLTPSSLPREEKAKVTAALPCLPGARIESAWSGRVTHVVMSSLILTVKAVNALAAAVPVVTPAFVTDTAACARTKQALPPPERYVPRLNEPSLNRDSISCAADAARSSLFAGLTFVFAAREQLDRYSTAIDLAGGKSVVGDAPSCGVARAVNGVILIRPPATLSQTQQSSSTDDSQASSSSSSSSGMPQHFKRLAKQWKSAGRALIPEANIGVAILKKSCQPELDPSAARTVVSSLRSASTAVNESQSHALLAPDTQEASSVLRGDTTATQSQTMRIPETLPSQKATTSPAAVDGRPDVFKRPGQPMEQDTLMPEAQEKEDSPPKRPKSPPKPRRSKRTLSGSTSAETQSPPAKKVALDEDKDKNAVEKATLSSPTRSSPRRRSPSKTATAQAKVSSPRRSRLGALEADDHSSTRRKLGVDGGQDEAEGSPASKLRRSKRGRSDSSSRGSGLSPKAKKSARAAVETPSEEDEVDLFDPATKTSSQGDSSTSRQGGQAPTDTTDVVEVGKDGAQEGDVDPESSLKQHRRKTRGQQSQQQRVARPGFLNKASAVGVTASLSSTANPDVTVEELSRSYCQLEVTPMVVASRVAPRFVASSQPGSLGRCVKNVKRFKKQQVPRPSRPSYCGLVTASQAAPPAFDEETTPAVRNDGVHRGMMDDFVERGQKQDQSSREVDEDDEELWNFN